MSKYAVVAIGAHQYRVEEGGIIETELLAQLPASEAKDQSIQFDQVVLVHDQGKAKIGQPFVPKASVTCEVLKTLRLPKVISFKIKRRKNYRRKKGHRQTVVRLQVKSIKAE